MAEENSSSDRQIPDEGDIKNPEPIDTVKPKDNQFGNDSDVTLLIRYQASMVLAGVGDALGYNDGKWEFCRSGETIMKEIEKKYNGIANLTPNGRSSFMLSDDTIMHIATAEALVMQWKNEFELLIFTAIEYVNCMNDMRGRAPGGCCTSGTNLIRESLESNKSYEENTPFVTPYGNWKGGCGAAMRSAPIGLLYSHEEQLDQLMKVSIESGRMTHNQTSGFLGSLATALLVHLAIRNVSPLSWGRIILEQSERVFQYCTENDQYHKDIVNISGDWGYFQKSWEKYLTRRNILIKDGLIDFKFDYCEEDTPNIPSYKNHDKFVTEVSYSGWGGSSGHDAPMIAYDAVLYALQVRERDGAVKAWESLCAFGMFHCGDSDSTGIISGAIWGAMFGFEAFKANHERLEYRQQLCELAGQLYLKSEELLVNDPLISDKQNKLEDCNVENTKNIVEMHKAPDDNSTATNNDLSSEMLDEGVSI